MPQLPGGVSHDRDEPDWQAIYDACPPLTQASLDAEARDAGLTGEHAWRKLAVLRLYAEAAASRALARYYKAQGHTDREALRMIAVRLGLGLDAVREKLWAATAAGAGFPSSRRKQRV